MNPTTDALGGALETALGTPYMLVGPWQPLLLLVPIACWAWLVSTVFDKHAARFFLGRETWNLVHMVFGLAALAVGVLMPLPGIIGFLVGFVCVLIVLGMDVALFVVMTNRDERVPETAKLSLDFSKYAEARDAKKAAKQAGSSELQISGPKGAVAVPNKETPEFAVRVAAEQVFMAGRLARASQLDLVLSGEQGYAISKLIDGVRQAGEVIPTADAVRIIDFWKAAAGQDLEDRRRRQIGRVTVRHGVESTEVRVTSSGGSGGMRLTLVYNPAEAVRRPIDKLGLLDGQLEAVKSITSESGGVVLLAGPSDGGRTTTLYAFIRKHDAYTSNVQTLELEMEDQVEGVRQNVYQQGESDEAFSTQLRSMLRRDPDVVGVGELPDVDTAKEIARADVERTRVYLSLRADSALAAAQVYLKAVGDAKLAADGLRALVAQKLARRLCENCRVPYQPPEELLKKLGLPAGKVSQLFKKGGQVLIRNKPEICPVCNGVGYDGQVGLFEVYPLGDAERGLIAKQDWSALRNELRKRQLPSIQQAALRKIVEGVTSVEEISRVTAPAKKK